MNRTQTQLFALKFSLLICAALAFFVVVSVLDTRPKDAPAPAIVQTLNVPAVVDEVLRVPAAIPKLLNEASPKPDLSRARFEVWKAPCLPLGNPPVAPARYATDSRWLRVTTGVCNDADEITASKMLNERNGYDATVFLRTPSHFTSDFIPLAEGKNPLHMEFTFASGRSFSYEWTVEKKSTVSN